MFKNEPSSPCGICAKNACICQNRNNEEPCASIIYSTTPLPDDLGLDHTHNNPNKSPAQNPRLSPPRKRRRINETPTSKTNTLSKTDCPIGDKKTYLSLPSTPSIPSTPPPQYLTTTQYPLTLQ